MCNPAIFRRAASVHQLQVPTAATALVTTPPGPDGVYAYMSITILRTDWHWARPKQPAPRTIGAAPQGRVLTGLLTGTARPDDRNTSRQEAIAGSIKRG